MASNAATTVFNVPELAEMILAHLSEPDLARNLRLCRSLNKLILGSKILRQRLFLEAVAFRHLIDFGACLAGKTLKDLLPDRAGYPTTIRHYIHVTLNPIPRSYHTGYGTHFAAYCIQTTFNISPLSNTMLHGGSLWVDTFVCQPPPRTLGLGYVVMIPYNSTFHGQKLIEESVEIASGVTLRDVFQRIEAQLVKSTRREDHPAYIDDEGVKISVKRYVNRQDAV